MNEEKFKNKNPFAFDNNRCQQIVLSLNVCDKIRQRNVISIANEMNQIDMIFPKSG